MRLSDKMTQTRHVLDDAYEGLGDEITNAMNEMFSYGQEAERQHIIKLLERDLDVLPEFARAIELKNGTTVQMIDSYDCCAFTELNKFLLNFENIEHVITGVSTENNYETWHIYAAMGDVLTLDVGYDPSNGYYGYGFEINVRR